MLQPWNFVEYKEAQALWLTVSYVYKNYVIKLHVKRKATAKVNICTKLLKKSKTLLLKQTWVKSLFSVNKRFHYDIYEEKLSRDISFALNLSKKKRLENTIFPTSAPWKGLLKSKVLLISCHSVTEQSLLIC